VIQFLALARHSHQIIDDASEFLRHQLTAPTLPVDPGELFNKSQPRRLVQGIVPGYIRPALKDDRGGSGLDTLWFYNGAESDRPVPDVFVDLEAGIAQLEGGVTLMLSKIENVNFSGYWGQEAWGDQLANHIRGGTGDDELHGRSGNDTLDGGGGQDTL
jgi:RTX calcium-binding nonapeptide repeat (4 copies)